ncbi:MAG TPA: hypothetical protein VGG76_07665 [Gemmatimonadaceae bacterium]
MNSEVALDCGNRGKARALRRWMDAHWNDATLALSLAAGTRFARSTLGHSHSLGGGAWVVGGLPIRFRAGGPDAKVHNIGQLSAQLHYASAARSSGSATHSTDWGVRVAAGSARSNAFGELTRGLTTAGGKKARAWSTGVEYMAAESVWLSVGVGDRFSELTGSGRTFVFTNLKWGLSRDPQLAAR